MTPGWHQYKLTAVSRTLYIYTRHGRENVTSDLTAAPGFIFTYKSQILCYKTTLHKMTTRSKMSASRKLYPWWQIYSHWLGNSLTLCICCILLINAFVFRASAHQRDVLRGYWLCWGRGLEGFQGSGGLGWLGQPEGFGLACWARCCSSPQPRRKLTQTQLPSHQCLQSGWAAGETQGEKWWEKLETHQKPGRKDNSKPPPPWVKWLSDDGHHGGTLVSLPLCTGYRTNYWSSWCFCETTTLDELFHHFKLKDMQMFPMRMFHQHHTNCSYESLIFFIFLDLITHNLHNSPSLYLGLKYKVKEKMNLLGHLEIIQTTTGKRNDKTKQQHLKKTERWTDGRWNIQCL